MGFWSSVMLIGFAAVFYIGLRGRQAFAEFIPPGYVKVYWALYLLITSSFVIGRRFDPASGSFFGQALTWLGAYTMAAIFYAFLILVVIDTARLMDRWLGFIPGPVKQSPAKVGLTVIILLAVLIGYGSWNAWHPVIRQYEVNIPKSANGPNQLHAVMISDIHLGKIVNNRRLINIVDQVNHLNPDVVFLAGDIMDGDIKPLVEQNMASTLRQLKPRLGTYLVLGNHDGRGNEAATYFESAGIIVLRDQFQIVDNSFYVVGRDYRGRGNSRAARPVLADIMKGLNHDKPIILLDHNPANLVEAEENGVDIQLSGHTHQGQMFPNNYITKSMYEVDWGYLRKDTLQVIVSTGVGTWGPPIRICNRPEIVSLTINFN